MQLALFFLLKLARKLADELTEVAVGLVQDEMLVGHGQKQCSWGGRIGTHRGSNWSPGDSEKTNTICRAKICR